MKINDCNTNENNDIAYNVTKPNNEPILFVIYAKIQMILLKIPPIMMIILILKILIPN